VTQAQLVILVQQAQQAPPASPANKVSPVKPEQRVVMVKPEILAQPAPRVSDSLVILALQAERVPREQLAPPAKQAPQVAQAKQAPQVAQAKRAKQV
jgi:hypothetical protein